MKQGRTLTELATELERQKTEKRDFRAPTGALSMTSNGVSHIELGEIGKFEVQSTAHEQIAQRLEIPKKYYDRMRTDAPQLLDSNVNHWFKTNNEKRLIRTLDGKARAFLSDKYRPLDNFDLAENALPILMKSGCEIASCEITDSHMYIKAITPKLTFDVGVNDIVQAGIVLSNSEIGKGRLSIEPLLYRLVCLNGAIVNDAAIRKNHVGRGDNTLDEIQEFYRDATRMQDDKAFWMKVRDSIEYAFSSIGFEKYAKQFQNASNDKIESDPFKVIEVFQEKYTLSETEGKGILSELIKSNDLNRFGLINAVTAYAQTVDSYQRSTELERLGGEIIELPRSQWEEISIAA